MYLATDWATYGRLDKDLPVFCDLADLWRVIIFGRNIEQEKEKLVFDGKAYHKGKVSV